MSEGRGLSRRSFLVATAAAGATLAACSTGVGGVDGGDVISAAEARRPHSGRTVTATLTAERTRGDLGGSVAESLAYNGTVPGPVLRAAVGVDSVRAGAVELALDHARERLFGGGSAARGQP